MKRTQNVEQMSTTRFSSADEMRVKQVAAEYVEVVQAKKQQYPSSISAEAAPLQLCGWKVTVRLQVLASSAAATVKAALNHVEEA